MVSKIQESIVRRGLAKFYSGKQESYNGKEPIHVFLQTLPL